MKSPDSAVAAVVSLNIKGGLGTQLRPLTTLLLEQDADILCLQECAPAVVPWLQASFPGTWQAAYAPAAFLGNAVLSRWPLSSARALTLCSLGRAEQRSAVDVVVSLPGGPLQLCCVHLDHVLEDVRIHQWQQLRAQTDGLAGRLVCGDLNALRREDYDTNTWGGIARERSAGRWEEPESRLLDAILAGGFVDAAAGQGHPLQTTSRFHTRIDYILAAADCAWRTQDYALIDAMARGVTDHNGVRARLIR